MQVISCERAFNFLSNEPKISAIPRTPRSLELREAYYVIHTFLSMNEEDKMADRNFCLCFERNVSAVLVDLQQYFSQFFVEMHLIRVPCKSSEVHFL